MEFYELAKETEKMIDIFLQQQAEKSKRQPISFSPFLMIGVVYQRILKTQLGQHITAGVYRKVLTDMNRAGVIKISGQRVSLASLPVDLGAL